VRGEGAVADDRAAELEDRLVELGRRSRAQWEAPEEVEPGCRRAEGQYAPPDLVDLTDREVDVLKLRVRGKSNAEITGGLYLSHATSKTLVAASSASLACATASGGRPPPTRAVSSNLGSMTANRSARASGARRALAKTNYCLQDQPQGASYARN